MPSIEREGIHLHFEIYGAGEPIFLLHGFSASAEMWYEHRTWLEENHQLILMDVRGHGLTSAPAGNDHYSWEIMAADVNHILDHLGIEKAIIGGLSMGGGIALAFALNYPERVKALILSDSAGFGVHSQDMQEWQDRMDVEYAQREKIVRQQGIVGWAYHAMANALVLPQIANDPVFREEYLQRLARFSVNGFVYAGRFVMRHQAVVGLERVKDLTVPTLVLIGDMDGLLPAAQWARDALPNRRFVLLKGVGHGSSGFNPKVWRKAVQGFLEDLARGRGIEGELIL